MESRSVGVRGGTDASTGDVGLVSIRVPKGRRIFVVRTATPLACRRTIS